MAQVEIDFPEDVFAALDVGFDQLGTELLETAAVKWYEVGRVSREVAARIAGVTECDLPPLISSVNRPRTPNEAVGPSRVSFEANRDKLAQLEMRRRSESGVIPLCYLKSFRRWSRFSRPRVRSKPESQVVPKMRHSEEAKGLDYRVVCKSLGMARDQGAPRRCTD